MKKTITLVIILCLILVGQAQSSKLRRSIQSITINNQAPTIHYVKSNGTGDGSSWLNAANDIQAMIDKSIIGDEVWVASGIYFPTTETIGRDGRSRSFILKDGVNLYGGFHGTETSILQRETSDLDGNSKIEPWEFNYKTQLSGDIDGIEDTWTKVNYLGGKTWEWTISGNEGNCYRVVTSQTNFTNKTYFDGFSIIGGNANVTNYTTGGGISTMSNTIIVNCILKNCFASSDGGGVYGNISNSKVAYCSAGKNGGGIFGDATNCIVENCSSYSNGGGIYGRVINCKVTSCSATKFYGGGINSDNSVENCFVENCTAYYGGGICSSNSINNVVINCSAAHNGGGIKSRWVTDCTISNCSAIYGGGIASPIVTNCIVNNCIATTNGGGINCDYSSFYSVSPMVTNCKVNNCTASNGAGIYASSQANYLSSIKKCFISNCTASNNGGGIYSAYTAYSYGTSSSANVSNCLVINCSAASNGGGIYSSSYSQSSQYYSYAYVANCTVVNCTSANNSGIYKTSTLSNSIVTNCIVENCTNSSPDPNLEIIDINKAFVKPTNFIGIAITDNQKAEILASDWHLCEGSPYINAGITYYLSSSFLTNNDFEEKPRVQLNEIDYGAYEYSMPIISMPIFENFENITDFENSNTIYNSAKLGGNRNIKWEIKNKKAVFSWETNLTTPYDQPFFTYLIDASQSSTVFLKYDMYYEAYSGTIAQLGSEKLEVEISPNLSSWTSLAIYSNQNGTIQNKTYIHDISSLVAGDLFYVRFRAFGENANNIEKWEIDNIEINDQLLVSEVHENKLSNLTIIYPNPTIDGFRVNGLNCIATLKLTDISGKELITKQISDNELVSISSLSKGIYIVKLTTIYGIFEKKILKK